MSDFPQRNPTLDKMSARLGRAGAGKLSPVLAGFRGRFTFTLDTEGGETLSTVKVYNEDLSANKDWTYVVATASDGTKYVDATFGTDTYTGDTATRNVLEWVSSFGTCRRQFFVINTPTVGGVFIDNQEAQIGRAALFVDPTSTESTGIGTGETANTAYWDRNLTFSVNILPTVSDEFFRNQEYYNAKTGFGNRYANTLRNWGGAETVEIFKNSTSSTPIVAETAIEKVDWVSWGTVSEYELTDESLIFRLRAKQGSSYPVDIGANIHIGRFPC